MELIYILLMFLIPYIFIITIQMIGKAISFIAKGVNKNIIKPINSAIYNQTHKEEVELRKQEEIRLNNERIQEEIRINEFKVKYELQLNELKSIMSDFNYENEFKYINNLDKELINTFKTNKG